METMETKKHDSNDDAHWQDVKERAAIAIMQAIVSGTVNKINEDNVHYAIKNSVVLAKGLIEQLKQDKK